MKEVANPRNEPPYLANMVQGCQLLKPLHSKLLPGVSVIEAITRFDPETGILSAKAI